MFWISDVFAFMVMFRCFSFIIYADYVIMPLICLVNFNETIIDRLACIGTDMCCGKYAWQLVSEKPCTVNR